MKLEEYIELKETYEKKKLREAKIQGELNSLFNLAEEKHGIKTLKDIENKIQELKSLLEDKVKKFDKEVAKLEEEINGQES